MLPLRVFESHQRPLLFFLVPLFAVLLFVHHRSKESSVSSSIQVDFDQTDGWYSELYLNSSLVPRDDDPYKCTKDVPCHTKACCGSFLGTDTGTCGFGSTFCGDDCVSQCDAKPECGKDADPPYKTCPLNVCCSAYGFCGTSDDFCDIDKDCQSNCGHPDPPAGRNKDGVLKRVIGYYESWSARRECYAFPPAAIPIEGLTHVNFAFAFIDPDSYEVTVMDAATPEELFIQTADIRSAKSGNTDLEVFISIGGWTFSDNNTATQPVFGDLSSSEATRQRFADNLVSFMKKYGFDGVDLDWEYPGAGDRGGKQRDTENYVLLLKTIREAFERSDHGSYGLTFTIPSSYWYLRWFDLPGMLEYADWVNIMSYDLHGVWDKENPIGNIVQGHTNLTEIKQSAGLLWRNKVPPEKVVLGIGFYGRSFQLKDPKCTTPGCNFAGAADAGPCTNSAGTLAYFEIQDIIEKSNVKPVHDKEAAVNYITFDKDQWVSYDTKETLQEKIKWANGVGLGGLMVWSVDQDDDQFSALTGLIGRSPGTFAEITAKTAVSDAGHWASLNGQKCVRTDCAMLPSCPDGYELAPFPGAKSFKDDCSGDKSRLICCPIEAMPTSCVWRGGESGRSCHGQCHEGEVTLFHSRHATVNCYRPGFQAACCEASTWSSLIDACTWYSGFNGRSQMFCPEGKKQVAYKYIPRKGLISGSYYKPLCCPEENAFENCHWVGKGTCDDNECSDTDVEVALDSYGQGSSSCVGGSRKKVLCCNTPKNLNPFLPVALDKVFPTLPPPTDYPQFDEQNLGADSNPVVNEPNQQTFGMVIIDGPSSSVSSLSKRDGSHLEVLSCEELSEDHPSIIQVVCMYDGPHSNCHNIEEGGVEGTIVRLPDSCGPGTYAVVHSMRQSHNQLLPEHIKRSAPPAALVYDVELSYDFGLVKKDTGEVYIRIDYSNSYDYWNKVVQGDPVHKRSLEKRFYSPKDQDWKKIYDSLRGDTKGQSSLSKSDIDQLLVEDDGKKKECPDTDAFLTMRLGGSVRESMNFGFTFVGTISPSWNVEEAYSFFDTGSEFRGSLSFDGRGGLDIPNSLEPKSLLKSPVTNFGFSHPGIVSFKPEFNLSVGLFGSGSIDGKFKASFMAGNDGQTRYNQPESLGDAIGSASNLVLDNAFEGAVTSKTSSNIQKRDSGDTLLAMYLNMQAIMKISLNSYHSTLLSYNGTYQESIDSYLRVKSNGDVTFSNNRASYEYLQAGEMPEWNDTDESRLIGSRGHSNLLNEGSRTPEDHGPPKDIVGVAIFGDDVKMVCRTNDTDYCLDIVALSKAFPELDIDPETGKPYSDEDDHSVDVRDLSKRARGNPRTYTVHVENGNDFTIRSLAYVNGDNGQALLAVNPDAGTYFSNDPTDCTDFAIDPDSNDPAARYVTEHVLELQYLARMLSFALNGWTQEIGQPERLQSWFEPIPVNFLNPTSPFFQDYTTWDNAPGRDPSRTGSPINNIWEAFGSLTNPQRHVNLQTHLNSLKERVFSGRTPMSDATWTDNGYDQLDIARTREAMTFIQRVLTVFGYLNEEQVNDIFADAVRLISEELEYYADRLHANDPNNPQLPINISRLNREYFYRAVVPRIENVADNWVRIRLQGLRDMWQSAINANNVPNLRDAQRIVSDLDYMIDFARGVILDTNSFPPPPTP